MPVLDLYESGVQNCSSLINFVCTRCSMRVEKFISSNSWAMHPMMPVIGWSAVSFVWILHVARNEHRTEDANCGNDGLKSGSSESPGHSTCIDTKLRSWSVRTWIHVLLDFVGLFGLGNCTKSTAVLNLCLSQQSFFEGRSHHTGPYYDWLH